MLNSLVNLRLFSEDFISLHGASYFYWGIILYNAVFLLCSKVNQLRIHISPLLGFVHLGHLGAVSRVPVL